MSSEKTEPEFIIEFIKETDVEVEYSFKNVTFTTFQDCIRFVKKENTLIKPELVLDLFWTIMINLNDEMFVF